MNFFIRFDDDSEQIGCFCPESLISVKSELEKLKTKDSRNDNGEVGATPKRAHGLLKPSQNKN